MAFLDAAQFQVAKHTRVESRVNFWGTKLTRDCVEYRLTWACDDAGGEAPAATYLGADLINHGPEIAFGGANGLYVAIYRTEGAWA